MSFLDSLKNQVLGGQSNTSGLGGLLASVGGNPQIVSAVTALLSTKDTSVGGSGGLGGVIAAFEKNGLGQLVQGWVAKGPNPPATPEQVHQALGADTMNQFAAKAGVPVSQAGSLLAGLLPAAIDHLTPDGKVPEAGSIEQSLSGLLKGFTAQA